MVAGPGGEGLPQDALGQVPKMQDSNLIGCADPAGDADQIAPVGVDRVRCRLRRPQVEQPAVDELGETGVSGETFGSRSRSHGAPP